MLPAILARPLSGWARSRRRTFSVAMHLRTTSVSGFLLMRSLAWLKPLRRRTSRYHAEQQLIERWLAAVNAAIPAHPPLALEIAECACLIKGYGETHQRGADRFVRLLDTLVDGAPELTPAQRAASLRQAREAALADPEGPGPGQALPGVTARPAPGGKPIIWLSPKRSETLSADAD